MKKVLLSSVEYSKNNTYICSENYTRHNGILTAVTLNTGDTVWTLRTQNSRFLPTKVGTGRLQKNIKNILKVNIIVIYEKKEGENEKVCLCFFD